MALETSPFMVDYQGNSGIGFAVSLEVWEGSDLLSHLRHLCLLSFSGWLGFFSSLLWLISYPDFLFLLPQLSYTIPGSFLSRGQFVPLSP